MNLREVIATTLEADLGLQALGLPDGAIYQAETAESPEQRPFITIRFGESEPGVGRVRRRPFSVWVYDNVGDYNRAEQISARCGELLSSLELIALDGNGYLLEIADLGLGSDFYDDGYKALVVPYRLRAVASGL